MKTLILFLALSTAAFSQELMVDDLRITSEKLQRKGEWIHPQEYGWGSYDCNRRFLYRCIDKAELDTFIIQILEEYNIDTEDKGEYAKSDRGDIARMWVTEENGWDVTIYTYKNQYDRWMIYIRLD